MIQKHANASKVRVLVIDDSALARKIISTGLASDPRIEVIGSVGNPTNAFEIIKKQHPDVITLDIEMPGMDGITFLKKLLPVYPIPAIIISSLAEHGKKMALDALEAGAVDIVTKPKVGIMDGLPVLMDDVCERVIAASKINVGFSAKPYSSNANSHDFHETSPQLGLQSTVTDENNALHVTTDRVIAIGASAGGVAALARIIPMFPANSPGIVIVQHMPGGFTGSFASRLNDLSEMEVKEAQHGDRIRTGLVLLAPGGDYHTQVVRSGGEYHIALIKGEKVSGHRPSVNVLFHTVAKNVGRNASAALLTGMGDDGANGLLEIRMAGGHTLVQDEQTSVVFGMPGAAWKRGAAETVLPIDDIPAYLLKTIKAVS